MKHSSRFQLLLILFLGLFFLSGDAVLWACPNCKDGLATDPTQAGLVRGFFWSILFLLSMPFLITAGMGGYFYWLACKGRRLAAAKEAVVAKPSSPFAPPVEELEPVEAFL